MTKTTALQMMSPSVSNPRSLYCQA